MRDIGCFLFLFSRNYYATTAQAPHRPRSARCWQPPIDCRPRPRLPPSQGPRPCSALWQVLAFLRLLTVSSRCSNSATRARCQFAIAHLAGLWFSYLATTFSVRPPQTPKDPGFRVFSPFACCSCRPFGLKTPASCRTDNLTYPAIWLEKSVVTDF